MKHKIIQDEVHITWERINHIITDQRNYFMNPKHRYFIARRTQGIVYI